MFTCCLLSPTSSVIPACMLLPSSGPHAAVLDPYTSTTVTARKVEPQPTPGCCGRAGFRYSANHLGPVR
eukprot:366521-Chlamydomonas_euryale.AAC.4